MLALAAPIWLLHFVAVAVALLNDRRSARREARGPGDDEASALDLNPQDIGDVEPVTTSRPLPPQSSTEPDRAHGHDDVT